jgi:threonylcarbamoyladenosine tRNA methylthiotransferase MtaB
MPAAPKFSFTTLGCRLNQAESDAMAEDLALRGLVGAEPGEVADVVVVNTCTVTGEATKASRAAIRRAVRAHPGARVVVAGCYVVSDPDEVAAIDGVDVVVTNDDKDRLGAVLAARPATSPLLQLGWRAPGAAAPGSTPTAPALLTPRHRVRANLKLQTGCDEWCTFCIIPTTRGPLRSYPEEHVIAEATARVRGGARELVLTGVHLGKYAYDRGGGERDLVRLLHRLLDIDGVERVRLSSILSRHLTDELIELIATEPRLCRYLHVPLQAGDDDVLEAMHRPYRIEDYVASVEAASEAIPGLALATDVIVGFPGETEDAFQATLEVVEKLQFCKLHVFRYSARPGTPAAALKGAVPADVRKDRSRRLIALGGEIRSRFLQGHVGPPLEVLVEDERAVDEVLISSGQTDDYVRVWFEGGGHMGRMTTVRGERVRADGIEGRVAAPTRGG